MEAQPGPRVLEIQSALLDGLNEENLSKWHPACVENAPALFFTCREAGAIVTETYNFSRETLGSQLSGVILEMIYSALAVGGEIYKMAVFLENVVEKFGRGCLGSLWTENQWTTRRMGSLGYRSSTGP